MRGIRPAIVMTAAILVVAATGCDFTPTAVHEEAVGSALFSNSAQARVDLCHRTGNGDYTKITVSDAAYATHMAHGDRSVGGNGECPISGTSFFKLTFELDPSGWWPDVLVVLYTETGTQYHYCDPYTTCAYGAPIGSTVVLVSGGPYMYAWSDPACTDSSCVMNGDLSVLVSHGVPEDPGY